jgi:hypothetical protein
LAQSANRVYRADHYLAMRRDKCSQRKAIKVDIQTQFPEAEALGQKLEARGY